MHTSSYIVVAGSTRPNRRSPAIAEWIAKLGEGVANTPFTVIDLRDLGLRLDDEGGIPAIHSYMQETTRAWGKLVAGAAGVSDRDATVQLGLSSRPQERDRSPLS